MAKAKQKYIARPSGISQAEVDVLGPYLHETLFPDGNFDKEIALEDAKRAKSPLNKYIDWNDKTAAHAHRLQQMQRLFTSFYCVTPEGYEVPSVVSVRVEDASVRTYMATTKAIDTPDICQQIIKQAEAGLLAWIKRYETFAKVPQIQKIIRDTFIIEGAKEWQGKGKSKKKSVTAKPKAKKKVVTKRKAKTKSRKDV